MPEGSILELVNKIYNSTTVLDFGALFSDGTPQFVSPAEPDPGDTVVIAGKGHENYQILKTETIHFDDREVAREALGGIV